MEEERYRVKKIQRYNDLMGTLEEADSLIDSKKKSLAIWSGVAAASLVLGIVPFSVGGVFASLSTVYDMAKVIRIKTNIKAELGTMDQQLKDEAKDESVGRRR